MSILLTPENTLPVDGVTGTLIGRAWVPGRIAGPSPIALRSDGVFDLSDRFATLSDLLETESPLAAVRQTPGTFIASVEALLANTGPDADPNKPSLLPPLDLQVIKAAGVTFAASMIERVIEEQAGGDAAKAEAVRATVHSVIGDNLRTIVPGSEQAMRLKDLLIEQGMWSQYLEVGIGPDAEIFTKAPVLAAVGSGSRIGIHPISQWNNPEPEVVLAVNSRGQIHGATLGNDVNLRDIEGRSALLLSKAKDNNASCAIGPFIRLFDEHFSLDDVRECVVDLQVHGEDGYRLHGSSSMNQISRDPQDLAGQTLNANHQYPDGFVLFLGTLFAPTEDRDHAGSGFTHKRGDVVSISSPLLGSLHNQVTHSCDATPWTFGVSALLRNLAARGLLER
ncbi:fumarylacetoacetate hydrolase [Pseudomonas ogarae]|uniref:fumarylacetoacetate hydrolase family protein n=1 Tax=Pseudomonas ogarae (strain DSM 112162 / CECT 30235 / F113) TaxID=1114970 RepID=UPI0009A36EEC|nr:fumarylacetoacetate hydrolase family protein [Pseudomonas ogarae]OPG69870.1 fumarylacetoacetate hydrolase [Pseudomonas ogarae]OPG78403.1 fumarylacetoacetate hydrolase [Pseudomonas ogarae]PBJ10010.1 Fumarylacetoacetate (FAA) hydrolase family protein [Pseudomonas ogarae]